MNPAEPRSELTVEQVAERIFKECYQYYGGFNLELCAAILTDARDQWRGELERMEQQVAEYRQMPQLVSRILAPWLNGNVSFVEWCQAVDRIFPV